MEMIRPLLEWFQKKVFPVPEQESKVIDALRKSGVRTRSLDRQRDFATILASNAFAVDVPHSPPRSLENKSARKVELAKSCSMLGLRKEPAITQKTPPTNRKLLSKDVIGWNCKTKNPAKSRVLMVAR